MTLVFERLKLDSRPSIVSLTGRFPSYSDFNFTSLYAWDVDERLELTWFGDRGVGIRFRDYQSGAPLYSLFCVSGIARAAKTLIDHALHDGVEAKLELVPAFCAHTLEAHPAFDVLPDDANHDYIISMRALAGLQGREFRQVRRGVQSFCRKHPNACYVAIDLSDRWNMEVLLEIFELRESSKNTDYANELLAFKRLCASAKALGIDARGITVDGRLRAFIAYEHLDDVTAMGHFWKADTDYAGAYQTLMHWLAQELYELGVLEMNIQQDLGIAGLRQAKQFLCPVGQLKKFTIRLAAPKP